MISVKRNLQWVRLSAGYDLVVTAGFMLPWTATLVMDVVAGLSSVLALERPVPTLDVTSLLFANLMGSVVVVWSLWRWRHPSRRVGLYDALARILFAAWQLFAVAHGATYLLLGFTGAELLFALLQTLPVRPGAQVLPPERIAECDLQPISKAEPPGDC